MGWVKYNKYKIQPTSDVAPDFDSVFVNCKYHGRTVTDIGENHRDFLRWYAKFGDDPRMIAICRRYLQENVSSNLRFPGGKYAGRTVTEVAEIDRRYIYNYNREPDLAIACARHPKGPAPPMIELMDILKTMEVPDYAPLLCRISTFNPVRPIEGLQPQAFERFMKKSIQAMVCTQLNREFRDRYSLASRNAVVKESYNKIVAKSNWTMQDVYNVSCAQAIVSGQPVDLDFRIPEAYYRCQTYYLAAKIIRMSAKDKTPRVTDNVGHNMGAISAILNMSIDGDHVHVVCNEQYDTNLLTLSAYALISIAFARQMGVVRSAMMYDMIRGIVYRMDVDDHSFCWRFVQDLDRRVIAN